jgi:hypothetical protein
VGGGPCQPQLGSRDSLSDRGRASSGRASGGGNQTRESGDRVKAQGFVRRPSKSAEFRPPTAPPLPPPRPPPGGVAAGTLPPQEGTLGRRRRRGEPAGSFGCLVERSLLPIYHVRTQRYFDDYCVVFNPAVALDTSSGSVIDLQIDNSVPCAQFRTRIGIGLGEEATELVTWEVPPVACWAAPSRSKVRMVKATSFRHPVQVHFVEFRSARNDERYSCSIVCTLY